MTLLVIAMTLIPLMDAAAKSLSTDYDMAPASVAFGRFFVQALIIGVIILALSRRLISRVEPARVKPTVVWVHLARGAFHGGASMSFFIAVKYMPLADTIAVFFVEPMIVLLLSALFLGEVVGWPRRIASEIAFIGALFVIQPSYELFGPVSLLPLLAAFLFAMYLLFTRRFGSEEHPVTMQLWSSFGAMTAIGTVIIVGDLLGALDLRATIPNRPPEFLLLGAMGLISAVAHLLVVLAFRSAPASVLAPFNYLEIVTATIFGYLVFDEFPGGLQWTGIAIIVTTGLFIFFRERWLELEPTRVPVQN